MVALLSLDRFSIVQETVLPGTAISGQSRTDHVGDAWRRWHLLGQRHD